MTILAGDSLRDVLRGQMERGIGRESAAADMDGQEQRILGQIGRVWHHACEHPKRPCNDCIYRWSEIETGKKKLRKAKERV